MIFVSTLVLILLTNHQYTLYHAIDYAVVIFLIIFSLPFSFCLCSLVHFIGVFAKYNNNNNNNTHNIAIYRYRLYGTKSYVAQK